MSENGLKFSTSKTVCIHFHQQYGFFSDLYILLGKTQFRGPIFDTKLIFLNHVQYLKSSCQKALDILRVVGHTDWGADFIVLLQLRRALVRSKLDYGCIVYGSARRSVLTIGSDPPTGLAYRVGAYSYISCPKSLRGGTRTVTGFSSFETVFKLCSQTQFFAGKSSLQSCFRKRQII